MVGQIGPLVQVGRKKTALAVHVLGGIAGGATIGLLLGFGGLLLRAALGDTLDTIFLVVVPAALLYAASVDLGLLRLPHITCGATDAGLLALLDGALPGNLRLGLRPRAGRDDTDPVPVDARRPTRRLLCGDLATAVAITTVYGAARAIAVVAAVESVAGRRLRRRL